MLQQKAHKQLEIMLRSLNVPACNTVASLNKLRDSFKDRVLQFKYRPALSADFAFQIMIVSKQLLFLFFEGDVQVYSFNQQFLRDRLCDITVFTWLVILNERECQILVGFDRV